MDTNIYLSEMGSYIMPVVLTVCLCAGYILKHLVPTDKINRFIPLIVGGVGVLVSVWSAGWSFDADILVRGLVSGLASTGAHQAFSNIIGKK